MQGQGGKSISFKSVLGICVPKIGHWPLNLLLGIGTGLRLFPWNSEQIDCNPERHLKNPLRKQRSSGGISSDPCPDAKATKIAKNIKVVFILVLVKLN